MKRIKQWLAARKLERITRQRRESYEIRDFAKRRAAMLRYTRKGRSCQA